MPTLAGPSDSTLVKALVIGDSGTGKTGLLASLVKKLRLNLRILDLDNKIASGILPRLLTPDEMKLVQFIPLRDKFKISAAGPVPAGTPKAFADAMRYMEKWEDGSDPSSWGASHVLVVDTLTFLSQAAWDWAKAMNPTAKEPRTWFYTAQQMIEDFVSFLTNESFRTNVIVNSHISYIDLTEGLKKGFPSTVGKALSPKVPGYFEHLGVVEAKPVRAVKFIPTAYIDAKTPLLSLTQALPVDSGLATFFEQARKA